MDTRVAVVAIGGNSLIKNRLHQTMRDQYVAAQETCAQIAGIIADGCNVVIAAGGGGIPVVADDDGTLRGVAAVVDKVSDSLTVLRGCGRRAGDDRASRLPHPSARSGGNAAV